MPKEKYTSKGRFKQYSLLISVPLIAIFISTDKPANSVNAWKNRDYNIQTVKASMAVTEELDRSILELGRNVPPLILDIGDAL